MAPEVELTISEAVTDRRLILMAAKIVDIAPNSAGATVRYRRRGEVGIERLEVDAIVDCTGSAKDPAATRNPAVRSLFDQGLARIDPLHMGIEEVRLICDLVARYTKRERTGKADVSLSDAIEALSAGFLRSQNLLRPSWGQNGVCSQTVLDLLVAK